VYRITPQKIYLVIGVGTSIQESISKILFKWVIQVGIIIEDTSVQKIDQGISNQTLCIPESMFIM